MQLFFLSTSQHATFYRKTSSIVGGILAFTVILSSTFAFSQSSRNSHLSSTKKQPLSIHQLSSTGKLKTHLLPLLEEYSPSTNILDNMSLAHYLLQRASSHHELYHLERWLLNYLKNHNSDPWIHFHLCVFYLKKMELHQDFRSSVWGDQYEENLHQALQMAYQISLLDKNHPLSQLALAHIAFSLGDLSDTWSYLQKLPLHPESSLKESYYLQSQLLPYLIEEFPQLSHRFLLLLNHEKDLSGEVYAHLAKPLLLKLPLDHSLALLKQKKDSQNTQAKEIGTESLLALKAHLYLEHGYYSLSSEQFKEAYQQGWRDPSLYLGYSSLIFHQAPRTAISFLDEFWISQMNSSATPMTPLLSTMSSASLTEYLWIKGLSYLALQNYQRATSYHLRWLQLHCSQRSSDRYTKIRTPRCRLSTEPSPYRIYQLPQTPGPQGSPTHLQPSTPRSQLSSHEKGPPRY